MRIIMALLKNGVNIIPIFSSIDNNFKLLKIEDFENLITEKQREF